GPGHPSRRWSPRGRVARRRQDHPGRRLGSPLGREPSERAAPGDARSGPGPGAPRMTNIAIGPAPTTIVFGTDGWRARVADEYTFENVRRCADSVAQYIVQRGEQSKGVVVAYDRRFASE